MQNVFRKTLPPFIFAFLLVKAALCHVSDRWGFGDVFVYGIADILHPCTDVGILRHLIHHSLRGFHVAALYGGEVGVVDGITFLFYVFSCSSSNIPK